MAAKMRRKASRVQLEQVPARKHRAGFENAGIAANRAAIVEVTDAGALAICAECIQRHCANINTRGDSNAGRLTGGLAPMHIRVRERQRGISRLRGRRVGRLHCTRRITHIAVFGGDGRKGTAAT